MCDAKLFEIYKLLIVERENDGKRLWVLFGLMNVINGGLLAIVATKEVQIPVIEPGIYIFGAFMSLVWLGIQRRMVAWIKWWEGKLVEIEAIVFPNLNGEKLKVFCDRKLDDEDGLSTKMAAELVPITFTLLWIILLFWYCSTQC